MLKLLTVVYFITTIPYFWYNLQNERDTTVWSVFIKCFPTLVLIPFTLLTFGTSEKKKWHTLALVFATIGDFFFAYGYEYEMAGSAAAVFALHHFFYLKTYWKPKFWYRILIPLVLWGVFLNTLARNNLPWNSYLVVFLIHFYGATLTFQTWSSWSIWKHAQTEKEKESSFWRALGFLTLVASDSMIAIGVYIVAFPGWELYVILTYFWCEYFIFVGNYLAVRNEQKEK